MAWGRIRPRGWIAVAVGLATSAGGCAVSTPGTLSPAALRSEVRARAPDLRDEEILVPHEVRPEDVIRARAAIRGSRSGRDPARALAAALSDPRGFALRYEWARTGTAIETIESGGGNCVALTSVYVGLARALGIDARYAEASIPTTRQRDGEWMVRAEHLVALVDGERGSLLVQFGQGPIDRTAAPPRAIDDLRATAHLYSNRGYEALRETPVRGETPPWEEARRLFEIATRVSPDFAEGWNNLGIALSRLGRRDDARRAYLTAIALDPGLASSRLNLGHLHLEENDPGAALAELREAARLDGENPVVHYLLARAFSEGGAVERARRSLERSLELDTEYSPARALLATLRGEGVVGDPAPPSGLR